MLLAKAKRSNVSGKQDEMINEAGRCSNKDLLYFRFIYHMLATILYNK
jgi:hypothetical protein